MEHKVLTQASARDSVAPAKATNLLPANKPLAPAAERPKIPRDPPRAGPVPIQIRGEDPKRPLEATLNSEQAAELIGCSLRTLLHLRQREGLPHIKLGTKVVFMKPSILGWLQEREIRQSPN